MAKKKHPKAFNLDIYVESHLVHYRDALSTLETHMMDLVNQIKSNPDLKDLVHMVSYRLKSEESLKSKLERKYAQNKKEIESKDLFKAINDLIGLRVLHLHRDQIVQLNEVFCKWFKYYKYKVINGPVAKVWDDDTKRFFEKRKIETERNDRMYTSVHYEILVEMEVPYSFEIQVRTLLEEEWSEVDHKLNYPIESKSVACKEQLHVFAHMTTASNRMVDAIFVTHNDHQMMNKKNEKKK